MNALPPGYLSEHFTLAELTYSAAALRLGLDNTPNEQQAENLENLCITLLEPARILLKGIPMHIDSGFRTPAVNHAVGSTSAHSAHLDGLAADVIPMGLDLRTAFNIIRNASLPFDQLIIECNAWLHISLPRPGAAPRRQQLIATGFPGHWIYQLAPGSDVFS